MLSVLRIVQSAIRIKKSGGHFFIISETIADELSVRRIVPSSGKNRPPVQGAHASHWTENLPALEILKINLIT